MHIQCKSFLALVDMPMSPMMALKLLTTVCGNIFFSLFVVVVEEFIPPPLVGLGLIKEKITNLFSLEAV